MSDERRGSHPSPAIQVREPDAGPRRDLYGRFARAQRDTYGYPVNPSRARHPACACAVPCQRAFRCPSPLHVGDRSMAWCRGGHPGDECDQCFLRMNAPLCGFGACAACGCPAQGEYSIERDGFGLGNQVELCNACGSEVVPTLDELWKAIAARGAA